MVRHTITLREFTRWENAIQNTYLYSDNSIDFLYESYVWNQNTNKRLILEIISQFHEKSNTLSFDI